MQERHLKFANFAHYDAELHKSSISFIIIEYVNPFTPFVYYTLYAARQAFNTECKLQPGVAGNVTFVQRRIYSWQLYSTFQL